MSHLARASAALAVLALASPAGALAAKKPKHTTTVRTVSSLPTSVPTNLSRKCGSSKSATKIRSRRVSRPTKQRIRRQDDVLRRRDAHRVHDPAQAAQGDRPHGPGRAHRHAGCDPDHGPPPRRRRPRPRSRASSASRCCTTTTASPSTSSATRSPTTAASPASRPCSTACARTPTRRLWTSNTDKGTLTISSGDNFLAGLNLRASFNRFDAGLGPFYDSDAMGAARLRRGHDRQPRVRLRARPPRAVRRLRAHRHPVPVGQHRLRRRAAAAGAARQRPDRRLDRDRARRRADRHDRRLPAGDPDDLLARATSRSTPMSRASSTPRPSA